MNIISIGTDKQLFVSGSPTRERIISYGVLMREMHIVVLTVGTYFPAERVGTVFLYSTNSWTRFSALMSGFFIARRIARERGFRAMDSLITTQDPFEVGLLGYLLGALIGLPLEVQIHTTFFSPYFIAASLRSRLQAGIARWLIPRVNHVRAVSRRIYDYCVVVLGVPASDVTLVPIFADIASTSSIVSLRQRYPQFDKIILMTSRFAPEKRIDIALRAFAQLRDTHPHVGLVIVGAGLMLPILQVLARRLRIVSSVIFLPWTDDLSSYYASADVYLLTSDYEGWGRTVIEAAAAARPIVMTDVGVAREVIHDGVEGIVVPVRDVSGVAVALARVLDDVDFASRLGGAAQRAVRALPDRATTLARYVTSWEETLRGPSRVNSLLLVFRYVVSGGTAAAIGIVVFSVLTQYVHLWYLAASLLAFLSAFSVSFPLQKFWTFQQSSTDRVHVQISGYFLLTVVDMGANTALMYGFVDGVGLYPLFAQLVTWSLIALGNFVVCRRWIFKS